MQEGRTKTNKTPSCGVPGKRNDSLQHVLFESLEGH